MQPIETKFDESNRKKLKSPKKEIKKINFKLWYAPISSSAPRPLGAAYVPILLSEVEQEQRPSGNEDREAIVVGAGLCDGEGERAYTAVQCRKLYYNIEKSLDIF